MTAPRADRSRYLLPGAALLFAAGILLGRAAGTWIWAPLSLIPAGLLLARRGTRPAGLLLAVLLLGWLGGYLAYHPALPPMGPARVSGILCDEVTDGSNGNKRTRLCSVTVNGQPVRGDAYWSFYPAAEDETAALLRPGLRVELDATVYAPSDEDNPGGFNFREYLLGQGMRFGVSGCRNAAVSAPAAFSLRGFAAGLRHDLSSRLTAVLGEEAGGYAAAMLLGVKSFIPESDREAFSRLGLAHLLSVSGFHVGVLIAVLGAVLCFLPPGLRFALTAVCLAFYALLTGGSAPVVRAAVLAVMSGGLRLLHRSRSRRRSYNTLALAFLFTLAINPAQLTSAGFLLTYGALTGIVLVLPALQRRTRLLPRLPRRLAEAVAVAFAAQLGVLLPQLYFFQEVAWVAVLLSPVAMAAGTVLITADWLVLALLPLPGLSAFAGRLTAQLTGLFTAAVRLGGRADFVTLWTAQANLLTALGWVLVLAALTRLWRKAPRRRMLAGLGGALLLAVSVVPLPFFGTEYLQLSVGNADSAILRDRQAVIVIDTGNDGSALENRLHQQRLGIDTLILTHLHLDHAGGLQALLDGRIPIGCILIPAGAENAAVDPAVTGALADARARGIPVGTLQAGDVLTLPSGTLTVVWPEAESLRAVADQNVYSLVLLAELRGTALLLTGDLDGRLERYAARPADLLKVAHHGSKGSTGAEFLDRVSPQAAILSCKQLSRQQDVTERLDGIPVFGTARSGAVRVRLMAGGRFTVSGYTDKHPEEEGDP